MAEMTPEQAALSADAPPFGPIQLVESLLFVAAEPVAVGDLCRALDLPPETVTAALACLERDLQGRGIRLLRHGERVQLVAAPEAASAIERFVGGAPATPRLSTAALETLAIIAYRQPITRAGVEAVRGVDSAGAIRTLLQRGLIAEVGRLPSVGRPVLYGTTDEFLKQFGLASLEQLPPITFPDQPDSSGDNGWRDGAADAGNERSRAGWSG